ncbi:hypothetical protein [Paenibacillus ferrarius]
MGGGQGGRRSATDWGAGRRTVSDDLWGLDGKRWATDCMGRAADGGRRLV